MHGSGLDANIFLGIGAYFLILGLVNLGVAVWLARQPTPAGPGGLGFGLAALHRIVWVVLSVYLLGTGIEFAGGGGIVLSQGFRDYVNWAMGPTTFFMAAVVGFVALLVFRKWFASGFGGWVVLDATLIFMGYSLTDPSFRAIVAKPDNVPISLLIYTVGFTTWLALHQGVRNDERIAAGQGPLEAEGGAEDKVLVWPDLVYTEMISMVIFTIILIVWSVVLVAPLEPPASTTEIPNPTKAPWYFLGLQEMLVYFDPWLAGVVLPTYIIIGLCAIPYIDFNKKGCGYYTFRERPFAITTFMFGFVVLWSTLIVLGTFLRGPNWNFFGPYEPWSPYKTVALNNVNLSEYFWILWLNKPLPTTAEYGGWTIPVRELPGILAVLAYFALPPMLLSKTVMRTLYIRMGLVRYMTMVHVLLMMAFLPVKMMCRWLFNLKYFVYIPEYFFNI